mgnify:CR=1 FL=1
MLNPAKYLNGFFGHKLFDNSLFNDFKKMRMDELLKWNNDFVKILSKTVPFTDTWNNMIDVQKAYFNSWLALNANLLGNLDTSDSEK